MPRHRKRKTDRKRQEDRVLKIRSVRRRTPDPKKLSRAFIAIALARAEAEAEAMNQQSSRGQRTDRNGLRPQRRPQ